MKTKERLWWTSRESNNLWYEKNPGECDSRYFPYATQFMKKFPWLAVRVFWICTVIRKFWRSDNDPPNSN